MENDTTIIENSETPDVFKELYEEVKELGGRDVYYDFDLAPCDCGYEESEHSQLPFTDHEVDSGLSCMELAENYYIEGNFQRAIDMIELQAQECIYLGDFGVYDELIFFIKFKLRSGGNARSR